MTVHRIHGGLVPLIVGLALIALTTPNLAPAQSRSLGEALAAADAAKGETVFAACRTCHTIEEGGGSMIGPNLWGVVGRPVAHVEGFNYSEPLKAYGGTWQVDRLDAFLADPQAVVRGSLMVFPGVKNAADRANLIAYLNQNSSSPLSLADAPGAAAAAAAPTEDIRDYGVLIDAPGVEKTFAYCTACHSEMIVAQQGKTRKHWADLLEWMVEEQGMTPIEEPDLSIVLDYLAANYNEDRPNFPRR